VGRKNAVLKKIKTLALAGNPDSGKSSLFNELTGLHQKVGNFPGITVEKKTGYLELDGQSFKVVDLPGTYSLFPKSADESVPFETLINPNHADFPDLIVYVLDASNIKRNLLFLTQIIDLGIPVIVALNMVDEMQKKGIEINLDLLSKKLDAPVFPIVARKGIGINELKKGICEPIEVSKESFYTLTEEQIQILQLGHHDIGNPINYRGLFYFHKLYKNTFLSEEQQNTIDALVQKVNFNSINLQRQEILDRYRLINEIVADVVVEKGIKEIEIGARVDKIVTHKIWGYLIFLASLFVLFQAIFFLADYPMQWIEYLFGYGSEILGNILPEGILKDLLLNGVVAGLSGVVVFIPQIAILFALLTIMEESGYLSRVVLLMDKLMLRFGMNGKSVVPLISGAACAVPAIMATRNIDNWKERLITIMVTPLMSCSARIPVYVLLIGILVPEGAGLGPFGLQGVLLFLFYILGVLAVLFSAFLFKHILKIKGKSYFVMELPEYRSPRLKSVLYTSYSKARSFVVEAGKVIMAVSVILWFLASFGPENRESNGGSFFELNRTEELTESYAGRMGKAIEPVVKPLGFDWKIGISLITSFAAREVFVGTMATLYSLEGDDTDFDTLIGKMRNARDPETGQKIYSTATVIALLVFFAFALQCMSTVAVTYKETNSAYWPILQFTYMGALAYFSSFIVYSIFS